MDLGCKTEAKMIQTLRKERRQNIKNRCSEAGRFRGLSVECSLIIIAPVVFFLIIGNKLTEI